MMLESQALGMAMLAIVVKLRHTPLLTRKLSRPELRLALTLLLAAGALETIFSILYYLVIDRIGAVLVVLIVGTSPIFSIVGGIVLLKEKFGARLALAAAITLGGVLAATLQRVLT
jgi:drug/metabolite transporter (DMT)-like permease